MWRRRKRKIFHGQCRLRTAVNFINVKRTNFSYERHFGSFYYVYVTEKKLPKLCSYKKFAHLTLMKLTPVVNFTNNLWAVFVRIFFCQNFFSPKLYAHALQNTFVQKAALKMLVKLTPVVNFNMILQIAFLTIFSCKIYKHKL